MEKVKIEFWRCFGGIWEPQLRRNIDNIWVGSFRSLQTARATWTGIFCSLRGDEYCEDFFQLRRDGSDICLEYFRNSEDLKEIFE